MKRTCGTPISRRRCPFRGTGAVSGSSKGFLIMSSMTSSRPYIIRALYEWIVDNRATPYILVDAYGSGVSVPQNFVNKDGQIVLNVSPTAVKDLHIGNEALSFNARFGGVPTDI